MIFRVAFLILLFFSTSHGKLVLEYRFGACDGVKPANNVFDSSGFRRDAIIGGNLIIKDGLQCKSAYFDGTNDIKIDTIEGIDFTSNFTMSTWVKVTAKSGYRNILSVGGLLLRLTPSDRLNAYWYNGRSHQINGSWLSMNVWYHIVFVSSKGTQKLYINGVLSKSANYKEGMASHDLWIGSKSFKGSIDEFKIFDQALDEHVVKDMYNQEIAGRNYDGSKRDCSKDAICKITPLKTPVIDYRFGNCDRDKTLYRVKDNGLFGLDATAIGGVKTEDGVICKGVSLDYGQLIKADKFRDVSPNAKFTVSTWIKTTAPSGKYRNFIQIGTLQLKLSPSNRLTAYWYDGGSKRIDASWLSLNTWYHIAFVTTGNKQFIYVNGELSKIGNYSLSSGKVPFNFRLGNADFKGSIDEFKAFDSALEGFQVKKIYEEELRKNNYDGTKRDCSTNTLCDVKKIEKPVLEYSFGNCSTNEQIYSVKDSGLWGMDGLAFGGVSTKDAKICKGVYFENGDTIQTNKEREIKLDSNFTISSWVKMTNRSKTTRIFIDTAGVKLALSSSDRLTVYWRDYGRIDANWLSLDTWYHIVFVATKDSQTVYVNGKVTGSKSSKVGPLGGFSTLGSSSFKGALDEFKVFDKALDKKQVLKMYQEESKGDNYDGSKRDCAIDSVCKTKPIKKPVLDYRFGNCFIDELLYDIKDNGSWGLNAVASGGVSMLDGIVCKGAYFEQGNTIRADSSSSIALDPNFTISMWLKVADDSKVYKTIISMAGLNFELDLDNKLIAYYWRNGATDVKKLLTNRWYHIAFVSSVNIQLVYIDGKLIATEDRKRGAANLDLVLGSSTFNGAIDEFKIFDTPLSGLQIEQIYKEESKKNNYDGTIRNCALNAICGAKIEKPVLEYSFGNCSTDEQLYSVKDSGLWGMDGLAFGGVSTKDAKICKGVYFENGDTIQTNKESEIKLDSNFTISSWVKMTNRSKTTRIFIDTAGVKLALSPSDRLTVYWRDYGRIDANWLSLDTWYHIVFVATKDSQTVYVNGKVTGSRKKKTGPLGITSQLGSSSFKGALDEFKIFNKSLNQDEVRKIYQEEGRGNNFNGEKVDCGTDTICSIEEVLKPILDYRFESCDINRVDGVVKDSSSNNFSGVSNALTIQKSNLARGGVCSVGNFKGSGYINAGDIFTSLTNYQWSASMWLNWNGSNKRSTLFFKESSYAVSIDNKMLKFSMNPSLGEISTNIYPEPNRWIQFIFLYDNKYQKIYQDGVLVFKRSQVGKMYENNNELFIGASKTKLGVEGIFNGKIDEFKIFNKALSYHNIVSIYSNEKNGKNYDGSSRNCDNKTCVKEDLNYTFDAWESLGNISKRAIKTKIIGDKFTLSLASLNIDNTALKSYDGSVCARLVSSGDENLSAWRKVQFFKDESKEISFVATKVSREARVKIVWKDKVDEACPLKNESNVTLSTDSFAIRPEKFTIKNLPQISYAGDFFKITIDTSAKGYNEAVDSSFILKNKASKIGCLTKPLVVNKYKFYDGLADINATYGDIGDINITIKEREGHEFALIDSNDTTKEERLIAPDTKTIKILPYEIAVSSIKYTNRYNSNWLYMADTNDISQRVSIKIEANDKNHKSVDSFTKECYAQDVSIKPSFKIDASSNNIKLKYSNGSVEKIVKMNKTYTLKKSSFKDSSAELNYGFNISREYNTPYNPINIRLLRVDILDSNISKIQVSKESNKSVVFYYGKVVTKDISTNKKSLKHSVHVDIYSQKRVENFERDTLNWHINRRDIYTNNIKLTTMSNSKYAKNSKKSDVRLDKNIDIIGGEAVFNLSNNWSESNSAIVHLDIPQWLWYDKYNDYDSRKSCSYHPCFTYRYVDKNPKKALRSGYFNGSSIDTNQESKREKIGVSIFR